MDGVLVLGIELCLLMDEVHNAALVVVVHLLLLVVAVVLGNALEAEEHDAVQAGPSQQVFHLRQAASQLQHEAFGKGEPQVFPLGRGRQQFEVLFSYILNGNGPEVCAFESDSDRLFAFVFWEEFVLMREVEDEDAVEF